MSEIEAKLNIFKSGAGGSPGEIQAYINPVDLRIAVAHLVAGPSATFSSAVALLLGGIVASCF